MALPNEKLCKELMEVVMQKAVEHNQSPEQVVASLGTLFVTFLTISLEAKVDKQ